MSDLEVSMMKRVGELNKEVADLKAEIKVLKGQPDPLTVYLYAAEHAKDAINKLKAEVERLKEGNEYLDQMHEKEMARSAFLCEQVERLTKAGDAMSEWLDNQGNYGGITDGWHKAKEVQS